MVDKNYMVRSFVQITTLSEVRPTILSLAFGP